MPTEQSSVVAMSKRVAAAMAEIKNIPRDAENRHMRYRYASTDAVFAALRPILAKHGIGVTCSEVECRYEPVRNEKGEEKLWAFATYELGIDGMDTERRHVAMAVTGPQSHGAMISYALKYWLRSKFLLDTGDADADDQPQSQVQAPKPAPASEAQRNMLRGYMVAGTTKTADWIAELLKSEMTGSEADARIEQLKDKFGVRPPLTAEQAEAKMAEMRELELHQEVASANKESGDE